MDETHRNGRPGGGRAWGRRRLPAAAVGALVLAAVPVAGQEPLTLGAALRTASDGAYAVRIAEGRAGERSASRLEAFRGILPTLRFESGYAETTDPVAAFGVKLRQRTIGPADFDPARLNRPDAIENWTGAVVLELPLLNADAWLGLRAASGAAEASSSSALWTELETRGDVVAAYYGATLAEEKVATLEAASAAAAAHVRQAEEMVEQGMVTKSDALLARVKAGEVDAELASARGDARSARRQLATLLGEPGTLPVLPDRLPSAASVRAVVDGLVAPAPDAVAERADVAAARSGLEAARRDVRRARSTWLPRINAFGRYDWHSPDGPYRGDENWTVGVMAQWTPLAGAAHVAESKGAAARREVAAAQAEAAEANARLEAETTADRLETALERLEIAERAVAHADEAHRIVARKYEGGLATVVELLGASATETRTRLERAHAVYRVITAGAERALAVGADPGRFARLDDYGLNEGE